MELRNDTLTNIPKNYWIWCYVGATISTSRYILYSQNSNFSEMLTKHSNIHDDIHVYVPNFA